MTLPTDPPPGHRGPAGQPRPAVSKGAKAALALAVALLLGLIVILHLTGVLDPSKLH